MKSDVLPSCVQAVWVYGSVARNTSTLSSDVDILLLLDDDDRCDTHDLSGCEMQLPSLPVEVATYSIAVMRGLIASGSLFAWHLANEGRPIFERDRALSVELQNLVPYQGFKQDFETLVQLFSDALASLSGGSTLHFDAGILATVCRNTALLLSATRGRPEFSPWSPVSHRDDCLPRFPLTDAEYGLIRACKLAGERGLNLPSVRADRILLIGAKLEPWLTSTRAYFAERCANVG